MYTGKTLFAQLMDFLPWSTFVRLVDRYDGDAPLARAEVVKDAHLRAREGLSLTTSSTTAC